MSIKNANDLRVIKTRANIQSAFIALLKEKPLAEISVKEICERALCSRNTFYLHFPYKEAILDYLIEDCIGKVVGGTLALVGSVEDVDENIIEHYNRNIIHAVFESRKEIAFLQQYGGGCDFSKRLSDAMYDGFLHNSLKLVRDIPSDARYRAYCRYLTGGIVSFILQWMNHPNISEEEAFSILNSIHSAPSQITLDYLMDKLAHHTPV